MRLNFPRSLPLSPLLALLFASALAQAPAAGTAHPGLEPILQYIASSWDTLTRSMNDCASVADPKVTAPSILYLPAKMPEPAAVQKMEQDCSVRVTHLPAEIHRLGEIDVNKVGPPGLLYLPEKYVVPGGRFNEMYGWDSYFIIRGLLRSGRLDLARGMVENFFYEVENYGDLLNANRTYYLTRSQPPFLSSMVVEVYGALRQADQADPRWLARAYDDIKKDYEMWNREPHLAGNTGLSRYYDFGEGPPPEALKDESGTYRKVADYFFFHPAQADSYIVPGGQGQPRVGSLYSLQVCAAQARDSECDPPREFSLSADYYKGDRSMRESGFDVSFRFGPFGSATHHYAPVCLNSLLYKTEKDLETISRWLGHDAEAATWRTRAEKRKEKIIQFFWDGDSGMFFDFDFVNGRRSSYRYATTFYPLWAGLATPQQAAAVRTNARTFEKPGGLAMSTEESGAQWDLPYGWANIELLADEGLRRYGFNDDADRISYEFLSMVAENFRRDGNMREKYNVVTRSSEVHAEVGYHTNVVGFGWTNAAFVELLNALPGKMANQLARESDGAPPAIR
ncbi:MAG TPA: trehalase family glycosidase [Candidatus Binatia bacterium]|nr:trehalase family glycosidase [Candidatus Binatia bacterium]